MQTESRTCQARLGNYAEVQLTLSKITINPPNRPIWFVDAAFCISKHPTSVKNHLHFLTFLPKLLHKSNKSRTFVPPEPAKPLNDAQMSGSFFYAYDRKNTIWQTLYGRIESYHSSPIKGIVDNRCEQG